MEVDGSDDFRDFNWVILSFMFIFRGVVVDTFYYTGCLTGILIMVSGFL